MEATLGRNSGSNLETFLSCVTPSVPLFSLSKNNFKEPSCLFQPDSRDSVDYFALEDLWDWYNECSSYGLGVPLALKTKQNIIQYYVPYLSAIQIYTSKPVTITTPRNNQNMSGSNEESESDSWSDDSATSEKLSKAWDTASFDDMAFESDVLINNVPNFKDPKFGNLYFHFLEWDSPYERIPLFDKINELSRDHPGLMSFKSAELSPASWMSIAWYPIYHVPARGNLKEMTTCFLTYHTISSLFQDCTLDEKDIQNEQLATTQSVTKSQFKKQMSLPPFGLATYKMQASVWRDLEASRRMGTLHSAADSWLKQLGVHQHDFNFFANHSCK